MNEWKGWDPDPAENNNRSEREGRAAPADKNRKARGSAPGRRRPGGQTAEGDGFCKLGMEACRVGCWANHQSPTARDSSCSSPTPGWMARRANNRRLRQAPERAVFRRTGQWKKQNRRHRGGAGSCCCRCCGCWRRERDGRSVMSTQGTHRSSDDGRSANPFKKTKEGRNEREKACRGWL